MTEHAELLESVSNVISGYRENELEELTPYHVEQWVSQFTPENQLAFLREFDHVIKQTFLSKKIVTEFLRGEITNERLTGGDHAAYWKNANFLSIQKKGQSQREMLSLFGQLLLEELGLNIDDCGSNEGDYIYMDDILFSGGRIKTDLTDWITNTAPASAKVNVLLMAYHTSGQYYIDRKLRGIIEESGKNIKLSFWRLAKLENSNYRKHIADVLWPAVCPDDKAVKAYIEGEEKYPLTYRAVNANATSFFSSEEQRQLLESEFLIAGLKIRSKISNPADYLRPLGMSWFGVGFGSLIVTYRNCPNNCPLALWWGDTGTSSGALEWYPLLPRKTYSSAENMFNDIITL